MPVTTTSDLLHLLTREPGRPRITWYGDGGERVELSGAVLENWVNKTANLLVEEFDAGPGTRVLLDLPGHWRTIVWALAVWRVGACVVVGATESPADVVVTDRPSEHPGSRDLVVVSLGALARRYDGTLPAGSLDAATAIMTYGDTLGWVPPADLAEPALDDGRQVAHGALLAAIGAESPSPRERVLLHAAPGPTTRFLAEVTAVLLADGSVVLVSDEVAHALVADSSRRERLVSSERITADDLEKFTAG